MRTRVAAIVPCLFLAAACGVDADPAAVADRSASEIVNGTRDGNRHPSTGAMIGIRPSTGTAGARCSGTLIAPTVFLTAAHCGVAAPDGRAEVTFDPQFVEGVSTLYAGRFIADPAFDQRWSDPHDIAVVVFDAPVPGITPARLPAANSLSNLPFGQSLTAAGYGLQGFTEGAGVRTQDGARWTAVQTLNATNPAWLRASQNPATGNGGTCYGDSGGPNFLGAGASETDVIAGITVSGDTYCNATTVIYRTDTRSARAFLAAYVPLP